MKKKFYRVLAIVLALSMILMMVVSAIISTANGEEIPTNTYSFDIELMEDEQALRVTQRLDFYNDTGDRLDRVMFAVYVNMFRRETTVMYEDESLALPWGYNPGGAEFYSVTVNGAEADWGVEGEGECFMRVACDLAPGEKCEIGFVYDVLLTKNAAFCGISDLDWRLSGFYPILCVYNGGIWEANTPVQHSRYVYTPIADYRAIITLPDTYAVACTGEAVKTGGEGGAATWELSADGVREFAISAGRAWRAYSGRTESGVSVTVYSNSRAGGPRALEYAVETVSLYEGWFGEFPVKSLNIVQSDYCLGRIAFPGLVWINAGLFAGARKAELLSELRFSLAEQYFGLAVYADPLSDSWLCESLCRYITYLAYEEENGRDALIEKLNSELTDSLKITMPGNLDVTSDGAMFTQSQYDAVVSDRGAAVMHQFREMLGREDFIASLRAYYGLNAGAGVVDEMDFLEAFNTTTGKDWEDFLTEILFNIDEYSLQDTALFE